MDLYDALKGGTSEEELYRLFEKDLKAAKEKLKDEAAAEQDQYIADCREVLAVALADYIDALFGDQFTDEELDTAHIESILKDFEEEINSLTELEEKVNKLSKNFMIKPAKSDDEILRDFLKTLK